MEVFNFNKMDARIFLRNYEDNIFAEDLSDEAFQEKRTHIAQLIEKGHFEYCGDYNAKASAQAYHPEVYNLFFAEDFLDSLCAEGCYLPSDNIRLAELGLTGLCHPVASINKLLYPQYELYTGISDRSNVHSWLYDPVTASIIEPTGIIRDCYYGVKVKDLASFIRPQQDIIKQIFDEEEAFKPQATIYLQAYAALSYDLSRS